MTRIKSFTAGLPVIEASRTLALRLSINVGGIETVPETIKYFEFRDPFGNRLSFYELLA